MYAYLVTHTYNICTCPYTHIPALQGTHTYASVSAQLEFQLGRRDDHESEHIRFCIFSAEWVRIICICGFTCVYIYANACIQLFLSHAKVCRFGGLTMHVCPWHIRCCTSFAEGVCLHVCMYVCVCLCMYVYIHTYIHTYIYIHLSSIGNDYRSQNR